MLERAFVVYILNDLSVESVAKLKKNEHWHTEGLVIIGITSRSTKSKLTDDVC